MKSRTVAAAALVVLAITAFGSVSLFGQQTSTGGVSSPFDPPLTAAELAEYKKISANKVEVEKFIATRLFMRELNAYKAELPPGVDYDSIRHGSPQPSAKVDIDYALTFDEQLLIYSSCLLCGGCGDKEDNAPTGHPMCGMRHPQHFDCGKPMDRTTVLSQLTPPASPEEVALFEKANACPLPEMPRFLATRQYIRKLHAVMAATPAGRPFDPHDAPATPRLLTATYYLKDEADLMMAVQFAEIERLIGAKK